MPGYEVNRFITPIDTELTCSICLGVLRNPVHDPCDHFFCSDCIHNWLSTQDSTNHKGNCPISQTLITANSLEPAPRIVRNLLSNLSLTCVYSENGCSSIIKYDSIDDHEANCQFHSNRSIVCPKGCGATYQLCNLKTHSCVTYLKSIVTDLTTTLETIATICETNTSEVHRMTEFCYETATLFKSSVPLIKEKAKFIVTKLGNKLRSHLIEPKSLEIVYVSVFDKTYNETKLKGTITNCLSLDKLGQPVDGNHNECVDNCDHGKQIEVYHLSSTPETRMFKVITTKPIIDRAFQPHLWTSKFACVLPGYVIRGYIGSKIN